MVFLLTPIAHFFDNVYVFTYDGLLELGNQVLPKRKVGHMVPEGHPGFGGKWPEYMPPKEGDSRCACPALNALANHGIFPRDGRNISFKEATKQCREVYNFSATFAYYVPNMMAGLLNKSYSKDTFDLEEINLHNGIEHDGSLTRLDYAFDTNQGKPHLPFIRELLDSSSGKDKDGNVLMTAKDIAHFSAKRRVDARASNPDFSLSFSHKMFASANNSGFITIFGSRQSDIESILVEERIPDGWESRVRKPFGLTFAAFNFTIIPLELETTKKAKELEAKAQKENQDQNENQDQDPNQNQTE